ncbi:helix-turn-helix domain-containing protein [Streptomyces sp. 372A]
MFAGREYRAEPTAEQVATAEGYGGVCRAVRNTALEQRGAYRRRGAWISYQEQARQLVDAKRDERFSWLRWPPGRTACSPTGHADVVGAKNTLAAGHGGCRTWSPPGVGRAVQRQPGRRPTGVPPRRSTADAGSPGGARRGGCQTCPYGLRRSSIPPPGSGARGRAQAHQGRGRPLSGGR